MKVNFCFSWAFHESLSSKSTRLNKLRSEQITSRPLPCVMQRVFVVGGEGGDRGGGEGEGMRKPSHQGNSLLCHLSTLSQYETYDWSIRAYLYVSLENLVTCGNVITISANLYLHQNLQDLIVSLAYFVRLVFSLVRRIAPPLWRILYNAFHQPCHNLSWTMQADQDPGWLQLPWGGG